jgi:hypothetical protein
MYRAERSPREVRLRELVSMTFLSASDFLLVILIKKISWSILPGLSLLLVLPPVQERLAMHHVTIIPQAFSLDFDSLATFEFHERLQCFIPIESSHIKGLQGHLLRALESLVSSDEASCMYLQLELAYA